MCSTNTNIAKKTDVSINLLIGNILYYLHFGEFYNKPHIYSEFFRCQGEVCGDENDN